MKKNTKCKKCKKGLSKFGFTLVELLATIAILSIIVSIVVYFAVNVIKDAKEKSYQVTINNVESQASNYVLEDISTMIWMDGSNHSYQYQCLTVQNLIDAGYFKGDVLESKVDENRRVEATDYVYLERDSSTKTITKNILLVGKGASYAGLCSGIKVSGNININVEPSGWAREKNITIDYKISNNLDSVNSYTYNYVYETTSGNIDQELTENFASTYSQKGLTVNENGTINAKIEDSAGKLVESKSLTIDKIDLVAPDAEIVPSNEWVGLTQTVTLKMDDNGGSGVKSYYFGKENPSTADVEWTNIEVIDEKEVDTSINGEGTWYLGVKDFVGNVNVINKKFEKIIYTIKYNSNGGTGSMDDTECIYGSNCAVSSNTFTKTGYSFAGWTTNASGQDDGYNWTNWSGTWQYVNGQYGITNDTLVLYARWDANTYTINYYLGDGTSTAGSTKLGSSTCRYKSSCTLTTFKTLGGTFPNSDNHWAFYGWGTSNSDKSSNYSDGGTFTYSTVGNINLYAIGSRTFVFHTGIAPTVAFYSEAQYWNPHSTADSYLTSITIPTAADLSDYGWSFLGYRGTNTASSTVTFSSTGTVTPAAASYTRMHFRTIYKRTLTISYNKNGGSGSTSSTTTTQYYNSGIGSNGTNSGSNASTSSFTLASNGFTKTGYTFSKWADGSTSGTQYAAGASYSWAPAVDSTTTTKTMYAIWQDTTGPVITLGTDGSGGKWIKTASSTITVTDTGSGVDASTLKYIYSTSSTATPNTSFTNGNTYTKGSVDGTYYLIAYACDKAGNCTTKVSKPFKLDNTPPVVTCNKDYATATQYIYDTESDVTLEIGTYQQSYLSATKYRLTYDDDCSAFYYHKFNEGVTTYAGGYGTRLFTATDNNAVSTYDYDSSLMTDEDGHTEGIRESDGDSCLWRATSCNCIKGYCKRVYSYTAYDQAGNQTSQKFTFYHMYENSSSLRNTYCDSSGNAKNSDKVCNES